MRKKIRCLFLEGQKKYITEPAVLRLVLPSPFEVASSSRVLFFVPPLVVSTHGCTQIVWSVRKEGERNLDRKLLIF